MRSFVQCGTKRSFALHVLNSKFQIPNSKFKRGLHSWAVKVKKRVSETCSSFDRLRTSGTLVQCPDACSAALSEPRLAGLKAPRYINMERFDSPLMVSLSNHERFVVAQDARYIIRTGIETRAARCARDVQCSPGRTAAR